MKEMVGVDDLRHGMFVSELDRPWLGTPFLLQGFLIDDDEQLRQLRSLCRFVYVDRSRSIGPQYAPPSVAKAKATVEPKRRAPRRTVTVMRSGSSKGPEFFEVLRHIRADTEARRGQRTRPAGVQPPAGVSYLGEGTATAPQPPSSSDIRERKREGRRGLEDSTGLLELASSWLKPVSDWLRGDDSDSGPDSLPGEQPSDQGGETTIIFDDGSREVEAALEEELASASPLYEEAQNTLERLILDLEEQRTPDLARVRASVSGMVSSVVRNPDALIWLNRLKRTDQYSYDHALDVSVLLMVAGRHIGLSETQLTMLGTAGLMQDLGKISLPPDLLRKSGQISFAEFELFKTHVERSVAILDGNAEVSAELIDIVRKHHERIDGSGYPLALANDQVGLFAEMAGLADTYCAMTRNTYYRKSLTNHQALERINRMRDVKFSSTVIDQFIQCIGLYPVGTLVKLNSGEVAVVISQNRVRRLKPRVMVLLGPDKSPNRYPPTLDLLYDPISPSGRPYRIIRALPSDAYGIDPQEFYLV